MTKATASLAIDGALGDALLEISAEAVLVVDDVSWRVVAANDGAVALYGAPVVGLALESLFGLAGEQAVAETLASAEAVALALETHAGARRDVRARARRVALDGCTVCLLALEDATDEIALARDLEEERDRHRALLDALGVGVVTLDTSGRVLAHNRFAPLEEAFGPSIAGRNFFLEIATSPEARAVFQRYQAWAHALDAPPFREVFEFEVGRRLVEADLQAHANLNGWDAVVRLADATDRREAEQELRRQTFQAEEAARRTRLVYQTANLIHRSLDISEVLETAVAETGRLLGASRCQVVFVDAASRLRIAHEYTRGEARRSAIEDAGIEASPSVATVVRTLQALAIDEVAGHPLSDDAGLLAASATRAAIVAPIAVGRDARGVLAIHQSNGARRWTGGDVELAASIAAQVALAIRHAEIHDRVRRQAERESIVARLAVALHAGGSLDAALDDAARTLGEATAARAVAVAWGAGVSPRPLARVWRREAERFVEVDDDPLGAAAAAVAADPKLAAPERVTIARFTARDGGAGALAISRAGEARAAEAAALAEAVAVHVGLAVGAASMLEAVMASKQLWEGTFDAMPDGIAVHDAAFAIVRANRAYALIARAPSARLAGASVLDLFEADRAALERARARVDHTGRPETFDLGDAGSGGSGLSSTVSRLETAAGPLYIHTVRDVTEQRQMQERLSQASKMASIGHLAAGVAHEINTPLATISGSAQSLARQLAGVPELHDGPRWAAISDRLEAIVEQAFRCKRITHELLSYAAPVRPQLAPVDLERVAREAVETVAREREGVPVAVKTRGAGAAVATDAELLRQVVINLVANALDAVEGRKRARVTVEVRHLAREARIAVRDTGPGVDAEDVERIFDPFFTTKPPGRGTGLGLSISQSIVASLGGRLELESRPARGATFTIRLARAASGPNEERG